MEYMLAQMSWPQWMLAGLIIVVCVLLMIVILLQRGRGGGLSGAFGGGGGSAAFGAKTGDVFTWITVGFTTVFVLLTVVANFAFDESAVAPTAEEETVTIDGEGAGEDVEGVQAVELGGTPVEVKPVTKTNEDGTTATGTPEAPGGNAGDGANEPAKPDGAGSDEESKDAPANDAEGDGGTDGSEG